MASEADVDPTVRTLIRIGCDRIAGYAVFEEVADDPTFDAACASIRVHRTSEIAELSRLHDESVVLDVRGATEFARGAIPGAVNHAHTRLADYVDELPHRKIIVHCATGRRAALAVPFLRQQGVDALYCDGPFPLPAGEAAPEQAAGSGGREVDAGQEIAPGRRASFSI